MKFELGDLVTTGLPRPGAEVHGCPVTGRITARKDLGPPRRDGSVATLYLIGNDPSWHYEEALHALPELCYGEKISVLNSPPPYDPSCLCRACRAKTDKLEADERKKREAKAEKLAAKRAKQAAKQPTGAGPCPRCGHDTAIVYGKRGPFYGCLAFPACKGSRNWAPWVKP